MYVRVVHAKPYTTHPWALALAMVPCRLAPVPVVAAMDDAALGGGLELALGCDLRVAAQGVPLGLPEVLLGVIPGCGGTQRLARLIGVGRAAQMVFTGKPVLAEEAERWGLVNYCVEQNQSGSAAYDQALCVARMMFATAPVALGMARWIFLS